jgi:hypothetical protein
VVETSHAGSPKLTTHQDEHYISDFSISPASEGRHGVNYLLAPPGLLNIRNLPIAAVRNSSLGQSVMDDSVIATNILRPYYTSNCQISPLEIDPNFLAP